MLLEEEDEGGEGGGELLGGVVGRRNVVQVEHEHHLLEGSARLKGQRKGKSDGRSTDGQWHRLPIRYLQGAFPAQCDAFLNRRERKFDVILRLDRSQHPLTKSG